MLPLVFFFHLRTPPFVFREVGRFLSNREFIIHQLCFKSLAFDVLTTPAEESGLSCLQSACIHGDVEAVSAILNLSPDKLHSAIALSVEIGRNTSHFPGKPISFALSQQGSEKHKQVSELVEHVTEHFQSQSLLHLAAKRGNTKHLRRLLDAGEHVDAVSPDKSGDKETPLMLAARFNQTEILDFLVQKGASLEMRDDMITV